MLLYAVSKHCWSPLRLQGTIRTFTVLSRLLEKPLPPRRKIDESEITEAFLKGSGPGGQKINKTSSAVQLKHAPSGIVIKCQETRSRQQNRKLARQILSERLDQIEKGPESRTAIKTERARVKKASVNKKSRRKYRKLAEEKAAGTPDGGNSNGGEEGSGHTDSQSSNSVNEGYSEDGESVKP